MQPTHSLHSIRGLTLAEVAMAMFIIGVGVLSIATVYLQHERTASITAQQSMAHRLADTMAVKIKGQQSPDVRFENAIGVRCAREANNVLTANAQIQAVNEVACWQESVATDLPSGAGSIALDESTVPPNYAITVSWQQPRGGLASYTVRVATQITHATAPPLRASVTSKLNEVRAAD
jgi:type IV pilus modification protein PilV